LTVEIAVECYADEDVIIFARDVLRLPLRRLHSFSQGEVINDLLVRQRAGIGMVDEDPGKSHHQLRDTMSIVYSGTDIELRAHRERHLIVIKPELEECFLRGMRRVGLVTNLGSTAHGLQAILNLPHHPKHKMFQQELASLYRESRGKSVQTFVTEFDDVLRPLLR
jgi:hypothetical protein